MGEEELIKKCLLISPKSSFVNGVMGYYQRTGKVTKKQMEHLKLIYEQGKIGEDY